MVKHWYGYGAQEAGRDSHFSHGKFAVYPGNNLAMHKRPFADGAFKLTGGTKMASAVMPIYSIVLDQDPSGENVGGSYSKWLIQQQLRDGEHFEGVICTSAPTGASPATVTRSMIPAAANPGVWKTSRWQSVTTACCRLASISLVAIMKSVRSLKPTRCGRRISARRAPASVSSSQPSDW